MLARRAALASIGLALSGCAIGLGSGSFAPPPSIRFTPDDPPRARILAAHGFNDRKTAFARFGVWAAERGFETIAYDIRGFGAHPNRGDWTSAEAMEREMRDRARALAAMRPPAPLFVLGESMGAALALAALGEPGAPQPSGVIVSSPAVVGRDALPIVVRAGLWLAARLAPGFPLTNQGLGLRASDNDAMLRALAADPLYTSTADFEALEGLIELMDRADRATPDFPHPLLTLRGAEDRLVPERAHARFLERAPERSTDGVARVDRRFEQGFHLLLRDLNREAVFEAIADWIDARLTT